MDGIILIDKPIGISSFGVVARVRRCLSLVAGKKIKVGHTGTLDPFASGLMIIVVGKACKQAGEFSKLAKVYEATICLGYNSSTGDPEGILTQGSAFKPSAQEVQTALKQFVGGITQTPPQYSAIKVNGVRAYKLARRGEIVDMPKRHVHVFSLELLKYSYPTLHIRAHVSSGTYIRTLAEDIGEKLHTGAYTTALERTKVGEWSVQQAYKLRDNEDGTVLANRILPVGN